MTDHPVMNVPHHLVVYGSTVAILLALLLAALLFFSRKTPSDRLLLADIAAQNPSYLHLPATSPQGPTSGEDSDAHDTIFILPDISHYTRFMTGNRFAFGHARHVVFSLLNAMIDSATKKLQLSKLEGDAALFFVDGHKYSDHAIGEIVMDIFAAFFQERERLCKSNICQCSACQQIADLDLKIFVHRGEASRFEFRGTIDHFGTDVIILHRMMKSGARNHRYVMVSEAAGSSISLPELGEPYELHQELSHIGRFGAQIYQIDDECVAKLIASQPEASSWSWDTLQKIRQNLASVTRAVAKTWNTLIQVKA